MIAPFRKWASVSQCLPIRLHAVIGYLDFYSEVGSKRRSQSLGITGKREAAVEIRYMHREQVAPEDSLSSLQDSVGQNTLY
jgi:hypothetical protein